MEPQNNIPQTPQPTVSDPPAEYVALTPKLPEEQPKPPKSEGVSSIVSTLAILIAAPLVAFFLTAFIFQSYEVDGPSMQTTLENHDRLLVLKVPRTIAKLTHKDYIPNRGDVIIFSTTAVHDGENDSARKQLIKRVVGLPGDRVVVADGVITIYNNQYPEGFNPDKTLSYGSVITTTSGNVDIVIKEGEVFVCGDNRSNSLDSRVIGTIPAKDIIGKLIFRIYPLSNAQVF